MNDSIYDKLATILDTLPSGFPKTEDGLEIRILKKLFTQEQADLFCDLKLSFETDEQISERTGRTLDGLKDQLDEMVGLGLIMGADLGGITVYRLQPWVIGIYELLFDRMDKELAEMCYKYNELFMPKLLKNRPNLLQVIPIEKEITEKQESLHYEQVSALIENNLSYAVGECICKKEKALIGRKCDKPSEVCFALAPIEGFFDDFFWGRAVSKEEMYEILQKAEEAGLVHITTNVVNGHYAICNCCGCCCAALKTINKFGINDALNTHYYAKIDEEKCSACGVCSDERCQVNAIDNENDIFSVNLKKCIGCGLCVSTCPTDAIELIRKAPEDQVTPPMDENDWNEKTGKFRGVDYSEYV